MTKIFLEVNGTHAVASADGKLTSGMVGLPVTIDYDDSWDGLTKTAFFRVGNSVRKRDSVGTYTEVPWEILRTHGNVLEIGIEGKNENGSVVIPTTWAVVSKIQQGAHGDIPAAPKLGVDQPSGVAGANIDDSQTSISTTWSSEKIDKEIKNGKSEIIKDNLISYNSCWSSKNTVDKLCPAFEESGAAVCCEPVEGYPLDVVTQIEPVQSGSGDPSPDNIRPITGRATCKLHHSGKNLCNYRPSYQVPSNSVVVEQLENGVIVQGSAGSTPGADYSSCGWFYPIGATDRGDNLLYLQAGQMICISADYTILEEPYGAHDGSINITLRDPNEKIESVARRVYIAPEVGKKYKISTLADIKTTGYYCFFISLNSCKVKIENIQVEIGATATEYEPYQCNTFTMELGQTVYGGSLDWKTGVLTITHELEVFDGNNKTLDYSIFQKSDGTEAVGCTATTTDATSELISHVCSHLRRDGASPKTYEYGTFYITGERYFVAFIEEFADANELTAWLVEQYSNGTPFTIGYQLSTPITVQLTPQEVMALSGTNCLISDTGNTTVSGKADPLPIIDNLGKRLAALEAAVVNNT